MAKLIVVSLVLVLVVSMAIAGVSNSLVLAIEEAKPTKPVDTVTGNTNPNNDNNNFRGQDNIIKNPSPTPNNPSINRGCYFHPNDDRCKPLVSGQCPPGFSSNDKGNCFPSGPCPKGFERHDNDESGKCFRKR